MNEVTTPTPSQNKTILRAMTFSAYDLQMLRIQMGLRLCANFRAKLTEDDSTAESESTDEFDTTVSAEAASADELKQAELKKKAARVVDHLRKSYTRLTDGIAKNRTLPKEQGFVGDELISTFAELTLCDGYFQIEAAERRQFRQFESALSQFPVYNTYLKDVVGIGPAMAAVLITYFDPAKAPRVSNFWSYCGLDVAPDGAARSMRKEHLIEREYVDKKKQTKTKMSPTFNPWLRARVLGAMAPCFLRAKKCPWRKAYDDYKNRLQTDPNRIKVTVDVWKKKREAGEDMKNFWSPGRIHNASVRYMMKMFLADFWKHYRASEGLEVTPTYHEAVLGHAHHGNGPHAQAAE